VRAAKAKLYGAKIDVYEMQKRSDERTRSQQKNKKFLRDKQLALKTKYKTFKWNVQLFNTEFPTPNPIPCPTWDNVRHLLVLDAFWDIGQLTHPGEAWAADPKTQLGIKALCDKMHASDELWRLACECRQAVKWGRSMESKLSVLNTAINT
ncbi:hypothetical protein DFH28DRAFT_830681, partial [Melampsora americana]